MILTSICARRESVLEVATSSNDARSKAEEDETAPDGMRDEVDEGGSEALQKST